MEIVSQAKKKKKSLLPAQISSRSKSDIFTVKKQGIFIPFSMRLKLRQFLLLDQYTSTRTC